MMRYSQNFRIGMAHPFSPSRTNRGVCARCQRGQGAEVHHESVTRMTCEEAKCEANAKGWFSILNVQDAEHAQMATWIKQHSRRRFWEWDSTHALDEALTLQARGELTVTADLHEMLLNLAAGLIVFAFPPGQTCFKQHLDREVVFQHNRFRHTDPRGFNEDWNEQADKVNTALGRG
jgi:hypothetical protein